MRDTFSNLFGDGFSDDVQGAKAKGKGKRRRSSTEGHDLFFRCRTTRFHLSLAASTIANFVLLPLNPAEHF